MRPRLATRREVASWAWWGGLLAMCAVASCTVENGTGTLHGSLSVPACSFSGETAVPLAGANPYDQTWKFLVGEPFDSISPRFPQNQLNIRMQRSSNRWEFADAITFWVLDSYEVARCMRHRMNADNSPDWDTALCDGSTGALGPNGEGRMWVGTETERVTSHFMLPDSCPSALLSADALGSCDAGTCPLTLCSGHGSWIIFSKFGTPNPDIKQPLARDFKVNNGEAIQAASFHVELCDGATVRAQQARTVPVPTPDITGSLDGDFSFVLNP